MLCRQRVLAEVNTDDDDSSWNSAVARSESWRSEVEGLGGGGQLINVRRAWTAVLCSPYRGQCQHVNPGYTADSRRHGALLFTQTQARGQTDTRRSAVPTRNEPLTRTPACMHRHTPTTTTTPPHDGRSTTSSTHQQLLALSRHTHTHTHAPASHSTAYMQQYHTRSTQPATTTYTGTQYTTTTSHITATARMLYETVHAIKCGEAWTTDKRRVNFKGCLIF